MQRTDHGSLQKDAEEVSPADGSPALWDQCARPQGPELHFIYLRISNKCSLGVQYRWAKWKRHLFGGREQLGRWDDPCYKGRK